MPPGALEFATMSAQVNATGGRNAGTETLLLDVRAVAAFLDCSPRHVYRLTDAGKMPPPVRVGALVRWDRRVLERWVADGCPSIRGGAQ